MVANMVLPYLVGLALSWAMELGLKPSPVPPWRRPLATISAHVCTWTIAYMIFVAVLMRPIFGATNILVIELIIVVVSYVKFQALREPFVFQDFEYFFDAIRYPRLYIPFLGIVPLIGLVAIYGAMVVAGFSLEAPISLFAEPILPSVMLTITLVSIVILIASVKLIHPPTLDASDDLRALGLVGFLLRYRSAEAENLDHILMASPFLHLKNPTETLENFPNLITVQSESFFDVRRAYSAVRSEVLRNFDILRREALRHGPLVVDAWGANTVRSEFAFLSGMSQDNLGVHRYNPYRRLAGMGIKTIASHLQALGYRTVCVHPYHAEFYRRHIVLPALGFDEFIHQDMFTEARTRNPYIGDEDVANRIIDLIKSDDNRPLYIHAITMENHGPLHMEKVNLTDVHATLHTGLPEGCEDLVAYVRHLQNADKMFGVLREVLMQGPRAGGLCIFGDHVPIMPQVYRCLGAVDGTTDYLLWSSTRHSNNKPIVTNISNLAVFYLQSLGLLPDIQLEGCAGIGKRG